MTTATTLWTITDASGRVASCALWQEAFGINLLVVHMGEREIFRERHADVTIALQRAADEGEELLRLGWVELFPSVQPREFTSLA